MKNAFVTLFFALVILSLLGTIPSLMSVFVLSESPHNNRDKLRWLSEYTIKYDCKTMEEKKIYYYKNNAKVKLEKKEKIKTLTNIPLYNFYEVVSVLDTSKLKSLWILNNDCNPFLYHEE